MNIANLSPQDLSRSLGTTVGSPAARGRFSREQLDRANKVLNMVNEMGGGKWSVQKVREAIGQDLFDYALTRNLDAVLLKEFDASEFSEYKKIASTSNEVDLVQKIAVRVSGFGDTIMDYTGEFSDTDLPTEEQLTYQVKLYGEIFGLDFTTATNDRLGALINKADDLSVKYSLGFWKAFLIDNLQSDPTYTADSKVLFHADHANDCDAGGAGKDLTYANLNTAWLKLAKQTRMDGTPMRIRSFYLVVGPDNLEQAEKLMEAEMNPDNANNEPNTIKKRIEGILWHEYLGYDWYLIAPKEQIQGPHVGFLQAFGETPQIVAQADTSDEQFRTLKKNWRVTYGFGWTWRDYRGVVRGSKNVA